MSLSDSPSSVPSSLPSEVENSIVTTYARNFKGPAGVSVDSNENVYVCDQSTIWKIAVTGMIQNRMNWLKLVKICGSFLFQPSGNVTVLAGDVASLSFVDGQGTDARFQYPSGMALAANGNLYVTDSLNNAIRLVTSSGIQITVEMVVTDGLSGCFGFILSV